MLSKKEKRLSETGVFLNIDHPKYIVEIHQSDSQISCEIRKRPDVHNVVPLGILTAARITSSF